MNTIETLNALLAARRYQDAVPGPKCPLRLRSSKTFGELADQAAYLLWNDLEVRGGATCLDVHRYPDLSHVLQDVLSRRIDVCKTCSYPGVWDNWSRTGGGVPTEAQTPPTCDQHAYRVTSEFSGELAGLVTELEQAACEFTHHAIDSLVHQAVTVTVKPYLIRHLATRYCDACEGEFRKTHL